jgi:hypothetical protein
LPGRRPRFLGLFPPVRPSDIAGLAQLPRKSFEDLVGLLALGLGQAQLFRRLGVVQREAALALEDDLAQPRDLFRPEYLRQERLLVLASHPRCPGDRRRILVLGRAHPTGLLLNCVLDQLHLCLGKLQLVADGWLPD